MEWLSYAELDGHRHAFDEGVWQTPNIDQFCSSTYWILPAARHFAPDCAPFIFSSDDTYGAFMTVEQAGGLNAALPLECGWGLAAPLIGPDADRAVGLLASAWRKRRDIDAIILAGLPPSPPWIDALSARFDRSCRIGLGERCIRRLASLDGGLDGFMRRRSPKFRRSVRQAQRKALAAQVSFERVSNVPAAGLLERILAVERASWKGQRGEGMDQSPSVHFYADMVARLTQDGVCRVIFARQHDHDIGFVFGAVVQRHYRGLQMSFDHRFVTMGLGNCLQLAMIEQLCAEGVDVYDLGTDMPYKARWAEETFETAIIALLPG
ncbi:MAG: GNAT family N-acetyltransferase [Myxococcota bacterium]|nr:GNAT family N-acetyltransferase [Myxococcota bacterium]